MTREINDDIFLLTSIYFQAFHQAFEFEDYRSLRRMTFINPDHLSDRLQLGQNSIINQYQGKISISTIKILKKLTHEFQKILKKFVKKHWVKYQNFLNQIAKIKQDQQEEQGMILYQILMHALSEACELIYHRFETTMFSLFAFDLIQSIHQPFPIQTSLFDQYPK